MSVSAGLIVATDLYFRKESLVARFRKRGFPLCPRSHRSGRRRDYDSPCSGEVDNGWIRLGRHPV